MQTLTQLLPLDLVRRSKAAGPLNHRRSAFGYRGSCSMSGGTSISVEFLKNSRRRRAIQDHRFHWHLTDDQGWRIEIKRYPKLTQESR